MTNLVSIIIPNYNRESLIGETLDSILAQTYNNWECIIVDDGSTDNSLKTINQYIQKDKRFKLFLRPEKYLKGANACRNIGMQKSKGDYVIFFDSDDLMTKNHVELKLDFILEKKLDFAVFKTKNFGNIQNEEIYNDYSAYQKYELNADNYLLNRLRIFTLDLIVSKKIINKCVFYYKNKADIENVLMTQLVLLSDNSDFKDEIVSLRRCHDNNLTFEVVKDRTTTLTHNFFYYYNILDFIYSLGASIEAKKFILNQLLYNYRKISFTLDVSFFEFFWKVFKFKEFSILLGIVAQRLKK